MISPFTLDEVGLVSSLLRSRYLSDTPLEEVEADVQLPPENSAPVACPGLYWEARGAHFLVVKVGERRYVAQFFYGEKEQFGTGRPEYRNLGECITVLLRLQSDHERTRASALKDAAEPADDEYHGPPVI
ncbi:MAG TPA: hypothetical protein VFV55_02490 [Usitatibacteraceae bacterium]|nr:hypothetical protein [Usitatibacteraceae bacterium]